MKKIISLIAVFIMVMAFASTAMAVTTYSAGSVYSNFITSNYMTFNEPGYEWGDITNWAFDTDPDAPPENNGIYYDGVHSYSNAQRVYTCTSSGSQRSNIVTVYSHSSNTMTCYPDFISNLHLRISKPDWVASSVKMSTYGEFGGYIRAAS